MHFAGSAEEKSRPGVELVGRIARRRGSAAGKVERAARSAAELGLPVVQMIPDQVEPEAELVRPMSPTHVVGVSVSFIGTPDRHPGVGLTEVRVSGEIELRHSALFDVGTVCARDSEGVETKVLPKVGAQD